MIIGDVGRQRDLVHRGRCWRGDLPWPGPVRWKQGIFGVSERYQRHLLGRPAPASQHRTGHRAVPEHGLHPDGSARYPIADHGVAPQPELTTLVLDKLIRDQPQQRYSANLNSLSLPIPGSLPVASLANGGSPLTPASPPIDT